MNIASLMKPKALFVMHLPPPVYGATIANEYLLKSSVINQAFDVSFVNLATNKKLKQVGKPTGRKLFSFINIIYSVVKISLARRFDICYVSLTASGPAFYKDLIVVGILKLFRNNIIYFFHNKGVSNASKNPIKHLLYGFVFHNTKSIILSSYLYPDIKRYVRSDSVFYCPYGIPISDRSDRFSPLTSEPDVRCRLLFLGNMMLQKGVLVLLDACKVLKESNIAFECHFVGGWTDITETEFEEYLQKSELTECVTAHGPKYNEEKLSFYKNCDIFVFPTFYHYETFGLVNLEAMQYGLPIVSTAEGGIPEAVIDGENGFLVPQQNAKVLAEKLKLLITDTQLRRKMGSAGQRMFYDRFTVDKFEKNVKDILFKAINLSN